MISQPWRHLDAILYFDLKIYYQWYLQYQTSNIIQTWYMSFPYHSLSNNIIKFYACVMMRTRARIKISKYSNRPRNCFGHVSDNFEHFKNFRAYASVRTFSARTARTEVRNSVFSMRRVSYTIISNFHSFAIILVQQQCRTRAPNFKIRACVYGPIQSKYAKMKPNFKRL